MCGIAGIYSHKPVATELYDSIIHLQHRGQDAAGIMTYDDRMHKEKGMGLANALLNHLSMKLPISRMQRDLTDSTTLRNQGVAMGHSYLALQNILKGLGRITINKTQMANELNNHWEVQGEAIQTILRKNGKQDAYEQLKSLTQGQSITADSMSKFVSELNISDEDKRTLLKLTPENYTGLSSKLVDLL